MARRVVALVCLAFLAAVPRTAAASSITQTVVFSGSQLDVEAIAPFNPALGTLESISVDITGLLSVSGATFPNGGLAPIPYNFQVWVEQSFLGLAGQFFSFADPAQFLFSGTDTGLGTGFQFATTFSYGFEFTDVTDLSGFVLPTVSTSAGALIPPPGGISALRSDFLEPVAPINQMQMVQVANGRGLGGPTPVVVSFTTRAEMRIEYHYTPVPVPEPATLGLLALGLTALAAELRRRARHG